MPLTSLNLNTNLNWLLSTTNAYGTTTMEGPDSITFNPGSLNVSTWNQLYANTYTIAASANQTINLSSLTNLVGETFGFGHVLGMVIKTTGGPITLSPGGSDPFVYNFGGTSPTWTINTGGLFLASEPGTLGVAVGGSAYNLKLTNNGATSSTVSVVIAGSTT